jgi:hypothetical protein
MATVQGVVISVSLETDVKKQGGGTYKGWELVYKTLEGEVRTIAKPVQGLRFNAALKSALGSLSAGDEFTLTQEKNAQGFNDVKSIEKGFVHGISEPAPTGTSSNSGSTRNTGTTSNSYAARDFETKVERAERQRLIVRQSSLAQAIAVKSVGAKGAIQVEDVLGLAELFADWVFTNPTDGQVDPMAGLEDDIPY